MLAFIVGIMRRGSDGGSIRSLSLMVVSGLVLLALGPSGFTRALSVRCQHCHLYAGSNPDDLTTFDFASDALPTKRTARLMLASARAAKGAAATETAPTPPPPQEPQQPAARTDGYDRWYRPLLRVDGAHSTIAFAVPFMGLSKVDGRFTDYDGALWFDPDQPQTAAVRVSILAKSIDTDLEMRDDDLRSAQFFDVEKYPRITFTSSRVERRGDTWLVTGPLTMHGVTREVTLPMRRIGDKLPDPWGNLRAAFEGSLTLRRADFGIAGNGRFSDLADFAIGPEVDLTLRIQAVQWNLAKWKDDPKSISGPLQTVLDGKGLDAAIAEYRRIRKEEPDKWEATEDGLSLLGNRLIQANRSREGLAFLELWAQAFPD